MDLAPKTLTDYVWILYKRRLAIYLIMLSAIGMATLLSVTLPQVYQASVTLFPPARPDVFSLITALEGTIRTPLVPVSAKEERYGLFGVLSSRILRELVAERVPERTTAQLSRQVDFRIDRNNFFEIRVRDRDPYLAARIANTYATGYNEVLQKLSLGPIQRTSLFIEEQVKAARHDLQDAEERLRQFKQEHSTVELAEETSLLVRATANARAKLQLDEAALQEVQTRLVAVDTRLAREAQMHTSTEIIARNPLIEQLQARLAALEIESASVRMKMSSTHPDVKAIDAQINQVQALLHQEVEKVTSSETLSLNAVHETLRQNRVQLLVEAEALQARLQGSRQVIMHFEKELASLPGLSLQMNQLTRDVKRFERVLELLMPRMEDMQIQERREIQTFVIVDPAVLPKEPVFPNLLVNVVIAGLLALSGSVFYCFFLEYIERVRRDTVKPNEQFHAMADSPGESFFLKPPS